MIGASQVVRSNRFSFSELVVDVTGPCYGGGATTAVMIDGGAITLTLPAGEEHVAVEVASTRRFVLSSFRPAS